MVNVDGLMLELDTVFASASDLMDIEMQAIRMIGRGKMVNVDGLMLELDAVFASASDLMEIEKQAIQIVGRSAWSTNCSNGGGSPLESAGTKQQGPTAGFECAIQPDGSVVAERRWKE
jgi:hypothetical protein